MKKFFTLLSLVIFISSTLQAQDCIPDPTIPDTAVGVFPLPYDSISNPMGGIRDTACINTAFEFVFTAAVGDSISLFGTQADLDSLKLDTESSITGLPEGLDYACNPPDCVFDSGTKGCVVIFGKATNTADIGDNQLTIIATVYSNLTPNGFPLTFPNAAFFPGEYILHVREESFSNCATVGVNEPLSELVELKNSPNPFTEYTDITPSSIIAGDFDFVVYDLAGSVLHHERIHLNAGENKIRFYTNGLQEGFYIYTIQNARGSVAGKMVIGQ